MVVIEGMDLPEKCRDCRFYYQYLCHVSGDNRNIEAPHISDSDVSRGVGCPLRSLDIVERLAVKAQKECNASARKGQ